MLQFVIIFCVVISGTTERICLIMGSPEAVRQVNNFIMEKIREKPESIPITPSKPDDAKNNFERHRQVIEVFQDPFSSSFHSLVGATFGLHFYEPSVDHN